MNEVKSSPDKVSDKPAADVSAVKPAADVSDVEPAADVSDVEPAVNEPDLERTVDPDLEDVADSDVVDPDLEEIDEREFSAAGFPTLLEEASKLEAGDDAGINALIAAAIVVGLDGVQTDMLVKAIGKKTGVGLKTLRAAWTKTQAEARKATHAAGASERARHEAEAKVDLERTREEESARLWSSCSSIALSATLLADMEETAHKLGVVNEGQGARAVYLVFTSRLLAAEAICLLRLGASASGKNYVVERTKRLIPEHAIVQVSGSSPKALAYYGGENPDALKHKIVYIPEAVILLEKKHGDADGGGFTSMFRTLISEGRIVYQVTATQDGGPSETVTIVKNGPIAAILTSADEIDPQIKTRVLTMETDESGKQTEAIVERILSDDDDETAPDLQPWLDLQLWLETEAPYRVRIPFKRAIFSAFKRWRPNFFQGVSMRMRRDVGGFLAAIKTSAVLHKAQRKMTENGVIIATIDDYIHAYEAFDDGLSSAHGKANEKIIAVVEAIEAMRGRDSDLSAVKVTLRDLAKRLRVGSPMTAKARLDEALEYGALEINDTMTWRGGARFFDVIETAETIRVKPGLGVFPPPDLVRVCISSPPDSLQGGQNGQMDKSAGERIGLGAKRRV
jgi:hypothetical protein